jgi:DNA polymerase V
MRATGTSMTGAGIYPGDLLIVDKSLEATDKKEIIAVVNGELTVKRLRLRVDRVFLEAENEGYAPIEITGYMDFSVWGVVAYVVHPV